MMNADEKRDALKRFMTGRGLTVSGWAKSAGIPESTLRMYLKGASRNMRSDTERKLADAAGCSVDALYGLDYGAPLARHQVWVKGYLGAGNVIQLFEAMGESEGFYEVSRPPGVYGDDKLVAIEIRGGSMPYWRDGDVVYCQQLNHLDAQAILGEACMVELEDGGMLFKEVQQGYEPGTFNLLSWDGSPMRMNNRIRRAMPMVAVVRKAQARL
ncbi:helix-turn-helix transcriptional regulator [Oceanicaulis alexandrii]|uniref:XRE family transcriptional regulator n=1 Tax=Oceanicaulis alexandrii TaxID=153233 RepID=UPI0035D1272C